MDQVKELVRKTVKIFNRYHSPEASAKLLGFDGEYVDVEFTGPYCRTCGYYDYFEDLISEADELGLKMEIVFIRDLVEYAVVRYRVRGSG